MSLEANEDLVRRFCAAIERGDFDAPRAMCTEDFVFCNQVDTPWRGVQGLVDSEQKDFEAFESFRFPIETLQTPELPLQFSLLNKAENLLETIDRILHEHSADEDDTAPDLIPPDTTTLFLTALVEFHAAWADFEDAAKPRAKSGSILERMQSSVGPELIFGEE